MKSKTKRIFLDYASTTPLDERVSKAMKPYFERDFGNPSALYIEGLKAKKAVAESRTNIARILNIRSEEVVFTASGTEADNLAILGVFRKFKSMMKPHIVTTNIEHPGILEACKQVEREGGEVTYVPVEENGIVDPKKIAAALRPNTVLVSVMYANNEIGTIQPLRDISRVVVEFRNENQRKSALAHGSLPYFHTDASQAANYLDLSFQKLGVDMMTLDASKIYGPKGIGLLALKRRVELEPIIFGGGQEKNFRSGTENVPSIVGFSESLALAQKIKNKESARLGKLRDFFITTVINKMPGVFINGDRERRLPNNVNICIPGLDAEFAVIKLDNSGISCSSASSCMNLSENSYSYVVEALGAAGKNCRESSLRFTFGRKTTKQDLKLTLDKIQSIIIRQ